ncbi:ubiquinone biosynthesis protein-like protein coq-8 [Phaeosphaeriaceae sp. PMI808]|nr:ubiquinone biosynthesis protein-like protein coq-8 [Phaeosphaeriaceae sp. PMI808]
MAGRRLVDAAKFFNASKSITQKHFALRSSQLHAYNKTSTLARAVKNQTDRVTLTAAAAIALSKRFSEEAPSYAKAAAERARGAYDEGIARKQTIDRDIPVARRKEGWEQDHYHDRSEQNSATGPPSAKELNTEQKEAPRRPLPDGTIPSGGVTLEQEGRGQIMLSERPVPEAPKEPLAGEKRSHKEDDGIKPVGSGKSAIPLPKQSRGDSSVAPRVDSKQDDIPEGINTDIFHSTRVAKMLGSDPQSRKEHIRSKAPTRNPFIPLQYQAGHGHGSGANEPAPPLQSESPPKTNQPEVAEEMQNLASQLAQDAQRNATSHPEVTSDPSIEPEIAAYTLRESRVPSSRFGRMWQYAGLGTSMALGAVGESLRRVTGSAASTTGSLMLSPGNIEILVAKLSRMRGAALKLGQMISIQDIKMLPPQIHDVLQRVQDSADCMPASQRNKVLASNLGEDWRDLFESFEEVPIAAASIGQVHKAVLKSNGKAVAVKVQYPGVANSIDSDLNNLSVLLTASRLLPKGLFLDKTIANARTELGWECNYTREAECQMRFREFLSDDTDAFTVPKVFPEASGPTVLTAELMYGVGVTKLKNLDQSQRDWIGTQILRLCLREIVEFKFMQTDPNWTNFLYNAKAQKVELLDFGASREYPDEFVEPYINILIGASKNDHATIRDRSIELGYLTGDESATMLDAHVQSVLTLAEPFRADGPEIYDFRDQTITDRVRNLIPVMVNERLAPPPEETYSLHRKLSGAFLLCARLGSRVSCRELFSKAVAKWEGRDRME